MKERLPELGDNDIDTYDTEALVDFCIHQNMNSKFFFFVNCIFGQK
jgi:hypothetical protein